MNDLQQLPLETTKYCLQQQFIQESVINISMVIKTYQKQIQTQENKKLIVDKYQVRKKEQVILNKLQSKMKRIIQNQIYSNPFQNSQQQQEQQGSHSILRLFESYGFQCLRTKNKYDFLFLHKNILFYCKGNDFNSNHQYFQKLIQIEGKLYQVEYDKNTNPQFLIQEGKFDIDLCKKQFLLNGQGIEYQGLSNNIKYKGSFLFGKYLSIEEKLECKPSKLIGKKIIINEIDIKTNQVINYKTQKERKIQQNYQNKYVWVKFNQQFNANDWEILHNQLWLTSSIIDSFVLFQNLQNEEQYYNTKQDKRKEISRILFIPTHVITSFGQIYSIEKAKQIFYQELLKFQDLDYNISQIYDYVGFPINKNNNHWYFVLFNLKENLLQYFDSIGQSYLDYYLISTLSELLKIKQTLNIKIEIEFQQQRDGYSCGYRICSLMKFISILQFYPQIQYNYNETEITQLLQDVIREIR